MEVVCALLLLTLGMSAAAPQDLTGKWLTFPQATDTDHVTLKVDRAELGALSFCVRVFSDLGSSHGLLFLTTNSDDPRNNLLLINERGHYQVQYNSTFPNAAFYFKNGYILNAWQAVCGTWDADSGLFQIWIDGKHSSRKFLSNRHMKSPMTLILGQTSRYGDPNSFDREQSFVGMMRDLHVWDRVLRAIEIQNYALSRSYSHGNVLDWSRLDFSIHGRVIVE